MVEPGGKHIILECDGVSSSSLKDKSYIRGILEESAKLAGATIISSHFHHFGGEYGVTGLIMLAESHISIHTWPETEYASIDVFMCGNCDSLFCANKIIELFKCKSYKLYNIQRESSYTIPYTNAPIYPLYG